jgi:hypothetical protein
MIHANTSPCARERNRGSSRGLGDFMKTSIPSLS